MSTITGAQIAAEAFEQKGIKYIFTLSGGHITPLYQYLEHSNITLFDTRHEQAAVFMAEVWGRTKREPGVALVTAGPGFTNALTSIANARQANSPLVLISGCVGIESCEKLDLQDMRQAPVIEPMVKKALICQKPERVAEFIDIAFRTAISGRPGPVYLEFPVDVLNAEVPVESVKRVHTKVDSHFVDLDNAAKLIDMMKEAKKPIIIAGSGSWYSDAPDELQRFVENTGAPVFTSAMGRGTVSDTHPLCFESSLAIRPGASLAANLGTDLVVMLGSRISLYYIFGDIFNPAAKFVQVDTEGEELGRNKSVDLPIVSDIKAFLKECNRILEKGAKKGMADAYAPWIEELKKSDAESKEQAKVNWESNDEPIHAMRLAKEINDFLDKDDDIVCTDGGDTQIWMGMTRIVKKAGRYLDSDGG